MRERDDTDDCIEVELKLSSRCGDDDDPASLISLHSSAATRLDQRDEKMHCVMAGLMVDWSACRCT